MKPESEPHLAPTDPGDIHQTTKESENSRRQYHKEWLDQIDIKNDWFNLTVSGFVCGAMTMTISQWLLGHTFYYIGNIIGCSKQLSFAQLSKKECKIGLFPPTCAPLIQEDGSTSSSLRNSSLLY